MDILDGVLACRLLNIANFPSEQKQLANATDSKMGYNIAKMDYNNRPRKVFTNKAGDLLPKSNLSEEYIKIQTSNEVYYSNKHCYHKLSQRGRLLGNFNKISDNKYKEFNDKYKEFKNCEKKQNLINSRGEFSRCNYYDSKFQRENRCPDLPEQPDKNL